MLHKYFLSITVVMLFVSHALSSSASTSEFIVGPKLLAKVQEKYGDEARDRIAAWGELMENDKSDSNIDDQAKMRRANDFFNQVEWLSDKEHWGVEDYWATPVETLATNGGDCEDFSVGKYFSLISAKVTHDKLRITYVKSLTYDQAHMVVAYYPKPDAEPLILDNINKTILPASQRGDLLPIYSFSGTSIWLAQSRGKKLKGDPMVSLPQWKAVNTRMSEEQNL